MVSFIVVSHSASVSSVQSISTIVLWVSISSAAMSLNSNTFCSSSFSPSSMAPFSLPASIIMRISSSVSSSSSSLGSTPSSFSTRLVLTVSSHTMGLNAADMNDITPLNARAMLSAFFMARRLGTSSPKTRVKKLSISVITTTLMLLRRCAFMFTPVDCTASTSLPAKLSAANALPKKPASVIDICIVAKKRAGWEVRRLSRAARLSPSAASLFSLTSFTESTAISAHANTALSRIKNSCSSNSPISGSSSILVLIPPNNMILFMQKSHAV